MRAPCSNRIRHIGAHHLQHQLPQARNRLVLRQIRENLGRPVDSRRCDHAPLKLIGHLRVHIGLKFFRARGLGAAHALRIDILQKIWKLFAGQRNARPLLGGILLKSRNLIVGQVFNMRICAVDQPAARGFGFTPLHMHIFCASAIALVDQHRDKVTRDDFGADDHALLRLQVDAKPDRQFSITPLQRFKILHATIVCVVLFGKTDCPGACAGAVCKFKSQLRVT